MTKLKLTSPAFSDGGEIPRECGYKHGNKVPPLKIKCAYTRIKSLALIMDDPDAMGAVGKVWVHWVIWNISPGALKILEDEGYKSQTVDILQSDKGMTDFGEVGYGGPAPPDKRHTYVFKLYALDSWLDLPEGSTKSELEKAMEGHIIEHTQLTGTYAP
jgi:hypothetical protein